MSLKNPVTTPGMDPGTVLLVAQRLNHYATPGPSEFTELSELYGQRNSFGVFFHLNQHRSKDIVTEVH